MAEIEKRCSTLRFLTAKIAANHGDFITKTFLCETHLCVSSSIQVLEDATFLVSAATIRIEPVSAALEEQPNGHPTPASQKKTRLFSLQQRGGFQAPKPKHPKVDEHHLGGTSLGLLKRAHTPEELDVVAATRAAKTEDSFDGMARVPARSWNRWKAAEQGKAAFVGLIREKIHYAFVPCVTYAHAMNESTHTRSFGLPNVHVVMVCPSAPGASCSLAECINGCTVWRVPVESEQG